MTEQRPDLLDSARAPTRAGVLRAADKVAALLPPTPLLPLEVDGTTIWCKAEGLQPVGAFKIRGAWHRMTDLTDEQRSRGVVGVSSGNHAQGVAWAAKRLGVSAIIIMPSNAPAAKIAATQSYGAEVVFYDRVTESRDAIAADIVAKTGRTLVHAYGDPWIIEGQGTTGIEIMAQLQARGQSGPDRLVVNCGGGGLTAGLALACPDAEIYIAEPEGWDDVLASLAAGEIRSVPDLAAPTLCDALQTPATYPINFAVMNQRVSGGASVTTREVTDAVRLVFERLHVVAEPGGVAGLAAILAGKVAPNGTTAVILSGGNIDAQLYARILSGEV